jgi:hypothetical protein
MVQASAVIQSATQPMNEGSYRQIFVSQFLPKLDLGKLVAAPNLPDQYDAVTEYMNDLSQENRG